MRRLKSDFKVERKPLKPCRTRAKVPVKPKRTTLRTALDFARPLPGAPRMKSGAWDFHQYHAEPERDDD